METTRSAPVTARTKDSSEMLSQADRLMGILEGATKNVRLLIPVLGDGALRQSVAGEVQAKTGDGDDDGDENENQDTDDEDNDDLDELEWDVRTRLTEALRQCKEAEKRLAVLAVSGAEASEDSLKFAKRDFRQAVRAFLATATMLNAERVISAMLVSVNVPPSLQKVVEWLDALVKVYRAKMATSAEEDRARSAHNADLMFREVKVMEEIEALDAELATERMERSKEVAALDSTLSKLEAELRETRYKVNMEEERLSGVEREEASASAQQFAERETGLQEGLERLRTQLQERTRANKESIAAIRRGVTSHQHGVETWITKYDQEMEEKLKEIQAIETDYSFERAELARLEAKHEELLKYRADVAALERQLQEEEAMRQAEENRLHFAARIIQRVWRNFVQRTKQQTKKKGRSTAGKGKTTARKRP